MKSSSRGRVVVAGGHYSVAVLLLGGSRDIVTMVAIRRRYCSSRAGSAGCVSEGVGLSHG